MVLPLAVWVSETIPVSESWLWLIMTENIFSKTIIRLRQRSAIVNNSRTQISRPKRHRLNESSTLCKKKDDNRSCRLSLQLIIKVPLTGTDAAEREQRASLFALCRAARRKTKSGGFRGRVTRCTLRKKKDDNRSCHQILC